MCFPVNFVKFLRTLCLQNTSGGLFLDVATLKIVTPCKDGNEEKSKFLEHPVLFRKGNLRFYY